MTTAKLSQISLNPYPQIIFMVGRGYLIPDASKIRSDCPKRLKLLMFQSYKSKPYDERPHFTPEVCVKNPLEFELIIQKI